MKQGESVKFEIAKLDANNLKEIEGFEEAQKQLVKENPYIEIIDSKTYKEAKRRWGNVRSGRTGLETQDKDIGTFVAKFRKKSKSIIGDLIGISKPLEDRLKSSIGKWEQKEEIRIEKKREEERLAEEERVDKIKSHIELVKESLSSAINKMTFDEIDRNEEGYKKIIETGRDFDCEEYDFLLEETLNAKAIEFEDKKRQIKKDKEFLEQQEELIQLRAEKADRDEKEAQEKKVENIKECYLDLISQCEDLEELEREMGLFLDQTKDVPKAVPRAEGKYLEMRANVIISFENRVAEMYVLAEERENELEERAELRRGVLKEKGFELIMDVWRKGEAFVHEEIVVKAPSDKEKSFDNILDAQILIDEEFRNKKERKERLEGDRERIVAALDLVRFKFGEYLNGYENQESIDFVKEANKRVNKLCAELENELNNI